MARDGQSLTLRASERCTSFLSKNFAKNLAKKLFSYSAVSPRLPYQANTNCILHFFVAKVHILFSASGIIWQGIFQCTISQYTISFRCLKCWKPYELSTSTLQHTANQSCKGFCSSYLRTSQQFYLRTLHKPGQKLDLVRASHFLL